MAVTGEHGRSSGPVWAGQRAAELAHADDAATQTSVLAGAAGLGTQQAVGVRRLATTQDWCALAVTVALRPWAFVLNFFWLHGWWPRFATYLVSIWFVYDSLDLVCNFYLVSI